MILWANWNDFECVSGTTLGRNQKPVDNLDTIGILFVALKKSQVKRTLSFAKDYDKDQI